MLRRLSTRLSSLFRRERYERELDRELSFHLDMLTEQHVRAGMPPGEARARRPLCAPSAASTGSRTTCATRGCRASPKRSRRTCATGCATLRRNPGFALVVIVTMALGIGANTAIFSVVNGVLLKPLPYTNGESLVVLHQQQPLAGVEDMGFSYQEILDYRSARSLEAVVEFHDMWFILLGRAEPERVGDRRRVGQLLRRARREAALRPRVRRAADDTPGAPAVLMLSHKYWQRGFGGDPSVVGRSSR